MRLLNHRTTPIRREEKTWGEKAQAKPLLSERRELLPGYKPYLNYKSPLRGYAYNKSGRRGYRADQIVGGMNRNTFHQNAPLVSHSSPLEHCSDPILCGEMRNLARRASDASNCHAQSSDAAMGARSAAHLHGNDVRFPQPVPLQHLNSLGHWLGSHPAQTGQGPHPALGGYLTEYSCEFLSLSQPAGHANFMRLGGKPLDAGPLHIPDASLANPSANLVPGVISPSKGMPRQPGHILGGGEAANPAHSNRPAVPECHAARIMASINVRNILPPGWPAPHFQGTSLCNMHNNRGERNAASSGFRIMNDLSATTVSRQAASPAWGPRRAHFAPSPQSDSQPIPASQSANPPNAGTGAAHVPASRPRKAFQLKVARAGNQPPE